LAGVVVAAATFAALSAATITSLGLPAVFVIAGAASPLNEAILEASSSLAKRIDPAPTRFAEEYDPAMHNDRMSNLCRRTMKMIGKPSLYRSLISDL
jgi:hypothetical protein